MKEQNKERGITLVALVITIIILLILSTIKADKSSKSFYYIEDSDETINNNGYLIPNIKFIRRS